MEKADKKDRTKEIISVGIDDGHAETKLALPDGRMIKIPSKVRSGAHGVTAFGRQEENQLDGGYETDGQRFTISDFIDGEGTRFDDYPFSSINRVLIHHGLRMAGLGGHAVKIATGLPVQRYFQGSSPNMETITRKNASIAVPVKTLSGEPLAEIKSTFVVPEGVAAWVDYSLSSTGEVVSNVGRPAAIVDIGGRTTDCVTVLPGWRVDHARSGTENLGVLDLHEALRTLLCAKFNLNNSEVSSYTVEEAVRTGHIKLWGKQVDVNDSLDQARNQIGEQILREVQRRIGRGMDLDKVLFVGGGASIFHNLKKAYPNADSPEHPQFANARGMLKFMSYVL
jgi:plasmid segregation protein ParM